MLLKNLSHDSTDIFGNTAGRLASLELEGRYLQARVLYYRATCETANHFEAVAVHGSNLGSLFIALYINAAGVASLYLWWRLQWTAKGTGLLALKWISV
jgi:hypothetical protein